MRTTSFEHRHQALLHLLVVGLASLSYVNDPLDIVWALVRNHADSAYWERLVFGFGTLMLFASAVLDTWANAHNQVPMKPKRRKAFMQSQQHQVRVARILLVLVIGLLLPLPGTIILLTGETILIFRLFFHSDKSVTHASVPQHSNSVCWRSGFRAAASKWGLTASMIAFVWTLQDRVAEIGAACSAALWVILNVPPRKKAHSSV